jgi:hypothetical protein
VNAEEFVIAFKRLALEAAATGDPWGRRHRGSCEQKSSLGAPRNAPLRTGRKPGAETALFL